MRPLHLLITDDDVDKRILLGRALSRQFPHASIFECHSGQEALAYFERNPLDAIITNHNMAPVNGIELVRTLRGRGVKIPIIMVSGHDEVRQQAEVAGVDLFLTSANLIGIGRPIAEFLRGRGLHDRTEMDSPD